MKGDYQNNIKTVPPLSEYKYENIFKLHYDGEYPTYNILQHVTLSQDMNPDMLMDVATLPGMPYTILSYNIYGTMDLWWLICIVNKIDNPIEILPAGTNLKVIKPEYVKRVIQTIKNSLQQ